MTCLSLGTINCMRYQFASRRLYLYTIPWCEPKADPYQVEGIHDEVNNIPKVINIFKKSISPQRPHFKPYQTCIVINNYKLLLLFPHLLFVNNFLAFFPYFTGKEPCGCPQPDNYWISWPIFMILYLKILPPKATPLYFLILSVITPVLQPCIVGCESDVSTP